MAEHEEISFEDELDRAMDADPFRPFVIKLTSGDSYRVTDPAHMVLGKSVVTYAHPKRGLTFFRKNQMVAVDIPDSEHDR
jgi:hypothetical protein